jgi:hypothetical protein
MYYPTTTSSAKQRDKIMSPDQFNQVVEAISEGRYSWACVLILRFAGYNPVHFMPYRTYSRLLKENSHPLQLERSPKPEIPTTTQRVIKPPKAAIAATTDSRIRDLDATEAIDTQPTPVRGGILLPYLEKPWMETSFKAWLSHTAILGQ